MHVFLSKIIILLKFKCVITIYFIKLYTVCNDQSLKGSVIQRLCNEPSVRMMEMISACSGTDKGSNCENFCNKKSLQSFRTWCVGPLSCYVVTYYYKTDVLLNKIKISVSTFLPQCCFKTAKCVPVLSIF